MNSDCVISCRIDCELKQKIREFQKNCHLRSETQAIVQLLSTGLLVHDKREELKDPAIVSFLQQHLYDSMLVDWIHDLDIERLNALYAVLSDARALKLRGKS